MDFSIILRKTWRVSDSADPWLRDDKDVLDPLTPVARKDRNALLICNLLVFAVFQVKIIPSQISLTGLSTNVFEPGAIKILVIVLLVYYGISFATTIGAEHRAWRTNLEGLGERRTLQAKERFAITLDRVAEFSRTHGFDDDVELKETRLDYVRNFNRKQQSSWVAYQKSYRLRMFMDGYVPLILTLVNLAGALVAYLMRG